MKKVLFLLFTSLLFLMACGQKQNESLNGDTIVIAQGAKPKTLDPHMYNSIPDLLVSRQFYNTLFTRDENGNIQPELVDTYKYNNDKELDIVLKIGFKTVL